MIDDFDSTTADSTPQIAPLPRVAIQAFCETNDVGSVIQSAASDRRMDKVHMRIQMGGSAAAVEAYRQSHTPNVILIESIGDRGALLSNLDALAEYCDPGTKVVVIGHVNDVVLYRELIRRGVSEYLIAPVRMIDLVRTLSELFAAADTKALGRTVAVIGARGGIGSSTVAHNLAWAASNNYDTETIIVDLDLPFGTAGLDFNQDPHQGVAEAIYAPDRLDANLLDRLLAGASKKLNLLAAPSTLERTYDVGESSLDNLLDLLRASAPAIIFDVPHLWTSWVRRLLVGADDIVVVATPDLASLRNTKNLFDVLRVARPNDRKPLLVLNMVGVPKRPEISVVEFAKALDIQPAVKIDFAPDLFGQASNNGQMIAEISAKSKQAEAFKELAGIALGKVEVRSQKKSLLEPLLQRIALKKS
jgi:pilus assembly protein CpaE